MKIKMDLCAYLQVHNKLVHHYQKTFFLLWPISVQHKQDWDRGMSSSEGCPVLCQPPML